MTQRRLTGDHLRTWVRYCEARGEDEVVGTTLQTKRCLGARTLQYIYQVQETYIGVFNESAWVGDETIGIDVAATLILDAFDRSQGKDEDGYYVEAPVTVAMLRETSVWGMLFPEEEMVS